MYRKCPECGSSLDPEEKCDCQDKKPAEDKKKEPNASPTKAGR